MAVNVEFLNGNSIENIDTNFQRVKTALTEVVGRGGDLPNEMNADLDMNGNNVLNGGIANFEDIFVDSVPIDQVVGIQGPVGPQGPIGNTGPQGETGDQGPTGQGLDFDVQVDDLTARDAYDNEPEGFRVLVSDDGGNAAIYSRVTATPGTWSDPAYIGTSSDAIIGPASSVTNNLLSFSNTTGKNAKDSGVSSDKIVRVDAVQSFTSGEQKQARENINATSSEDVEDLFQLHAVPVGMVFFSPKGTVPAGYLALEGASFDEEVYVELYDYLGTNVLPDYTDRVLRHAGPLAGVVFTTQEDAFQGHWHDEVWNVINGGFFISGGSNNVRNSSGSIPSVAAPGYSGIKGAITDGTNGTPRTATETRVKAAIGKFVIKAYAALVDGGTADLVAIEAAQQYMVRFDAQVLTAMQQQQAMANLGVPITKYYESAEQTVTAGGSLTFTHGLEAVPKIVTVDAICKTAENGFSVDDLVDLSASLPGQAGSSGNNHGFMVFKDAIQFGVKLGTVTNPLWTKNKTTGAGVFLTNANWRLIVRAWA